MWPFGTGSVARRSLMSWRMLSVRYTSEPGRRGCTYTFDYARADPRDETLQALGAMGRHYEGGALLGGSQKRGAFLQAGFERLQSILKGG